MKFSVKKPASLVYPTVKTVRSYVY